MGRSRGAALSDSGGQTRTTLRALPGVPMVMPQAPMTTTNLLLVEDDEFVRLSLARALNRTGVFAVLPAENGQQALELLDGQQVDAILTDLQMASTCWPSSSSRDRKSTRLNSSHSQISYAVFCLKKKKIRYRC